MDQYVMTDRITLNNVKISIQDDEFVMTSTSDQASNEPVLIDEIDYTRWKLFVSDGELGWETTNDPFVEIIFLTDTVTGRERRLILSNGNFGWTGSTRVPRFKVNKTIRVFSVTKPKNRVFIVAKHRILS